MYGRPHDVSRSNDHNKSNLYWINNNSILKTINARIKKINDFFDTVEEMIKFWNRADFNDSFRILKNYFILDLITTGMETEITTTTTVEPTTVELQINGKAFSLISSYIVLKS